MKATRKIGSETSATRLLILHHAELLLIEQGYSAVTTRAVAARGGLKSQHIHYYFPSTDDLLLAVYRRGAESAQKRRMEAIASQKPLEALWALSRNPEHAALSTELTALANHRLTIRDELVASSERDRAILAESLTLSLGPSAEKLPWKPYGVMLLIECASRTLLSEESFGLQFGNAEVRSLIDWLLNFVNENMASADPPSP